MALSETLQRKNRETGGGGGRGMGTVSLNIGLVYSEEVK